MSLTYKPFTVELTYLPLNAIALTGNAASAANCFATLPATFDAAKVHSALLALSFDAIQGAFNQMSPAYVSDLTEIKLLDALLVRSTLTKHLQGCKGSGFWANGAAEWQHQSSSRCFSEYCDRTLCGTLGCDYCFRNGAVGAVFSTTYDHFRSSQLTAFINGYFGGVYGCWECNGLSLNGAFLGGVQRNRATRELCFGGIDRAASSRYNGYEWLINFSSGYEMCYCTPYVNFNYVQQHEESYTEEGACSLNLCVKPKQAKLFQGEAGVLLKTAYSACNGVLTPSVALSYVNQTPLSN